MSAGYVVLDEWVDAAKNAAWGPYWHSMTPEQQGKAFDEMRAALAAVIPAIQNAALERAAVDVEQWAAAVEAKAPASPTIIQAHMHAAAIRALKEGA
jgi:hypothetical protein